MRYRRSCATRGASRMQHVLGNAAGSGARVTGTRTQRLGTRGLGDPMATAESFERRGLTSRVIRNRGAETLAVLLILLACSSTGAAAPGGGQSGGADWTRFGWDAGPSNASTIAAGTTPPNTASPGRPP